MDPKHITMVIVSAIIGVIMLVTIVSPIVADGQTTTGDPVTYTNGGFSDRELYVTNDVSGTHTMSLTANPDGKVTYDGVEQAAATLGFYVVSDTVTVCSTGAYITICWDEFSRQYDANWGTTFEITWTDGTATVDVTTSGTTTTYTLPYTWIGYRVPSGQGNYVMVNSTWNVYQTSAKDFIAMGFYSTGENDTYYCLYDGKLTLSEDYAGSVNLGTPVAGTTDVKNGYLSISVGDESFNPYIWAVAKEIQGHKTSGSLYSMLGVIPIVVAIGIVLGVVSMAIVNRYD